MQCFTACILLLIICGPLLINSKKVVLLVPNQIRRSPTPRVTIQHRSPYGKRPLHGKYRPYEPQGQIYYGKAKPNYDKSKLPHGGDDFDQGHEGVDHVMIPHGKGISHGISFGRGYIPYDKIKGDFTRVQDDYRNQESRHEPSYVPSATGPADYQKPEKYSLPDPFYPDNPEEVIKPKYLRSIDHSGIKTSNVKSSELHYKDESDDSAQLSSPGNGGFVVSDSVFMDEYNKQMEEFTKSWPKIAGFGNARPSSRGQFGALTGGAASPYGIQMAQGRRGYSVQEDVVEPTPDFRNIITTPFQRGQATKSVGVSSLISVQG